MAFKSVLIVALLFSVLILCLQGTYADRIEGWGDWEGGHPSASASASGATGGFGNGNWDRQGYGFSSGSCYEMRCDSGPKWYLTGGDDEEKQKKRAKAKIKREGKSSGEGDDEERTAAPRKKRCVWTKPLREKFMLAIAHIGLDKAQPKNILEFMNEAGLTIRNVASHLQKYRIFLKELEVAVAGDEDMRDRLRKSSFAFAHPELFFNSNEQDQHHSQLLKQQQTGTSIDSAFQPSAGIGSTLPLTPAASDQFANYQQSSTSKSRRSIPQPIGSEQLSQLNNNPANFLRQQPMLGNGNGDQLFGQANHPPAASGMQQPSNNFENGGMSCDPMNNLGLTNNDNGTNSGHHQLTSNFSGSQMMRSSGRELVRSMGSQPAGMFNNIIGGGFANGVRNMNLTNVPMGNNSGNFDSDYMAQFGVDWQSLSSAGFETDASSAYQFPPNLPNNNGDLDSDYIAQFGVDWQSLSSAGFETDASSAYQFPNNNGDLDSDYIAQFGVDWQSLSSAGFETDASSAYQFPPNLPNNNGDLDQQQYVPVLPPSAGNFNDHCDLPNSNLGGGNVENSNEGFMNNANTVVAPPALINNNNISREQESVSDVDILMMLSDFF